MIEGPAADGTQRGCGGPFPASLASTVSHSTQSDTILALSKEVLDSPAIGADEGEGTSPPHCHRTIRARCDCH